MARVRILPDRVANQIAAGEVIERPAAVVKELVENALDAGANKVEVEFRAGGRALMIVEDNGSGMDRDDAMLALERHATSKIKEANDLDHLASYGFRGEALPSIASVSRFNLQTRLKGDDIGTEVLVNGGRFVHVRDCGRPVGTRIEVAQLFNSVPARRKFLKSDQTEAAHIVQCVRLYALARPDVAFVLVEDGRTIFRSPECTQLSDRVAEIFGKQIAESLVPINAQEGSIRLQGLIGRPGIGRATRHEMITFVNQRPVDSKTLNYSLIESYQESLPKGRYPLAFVFLEVDPAAVDVNVHPAKREIRFRSETAVRGFVIRSVLQRLREMVGLPGAPAPASGVSVSPAAVPLDSAAMHPTGTVTGLPGGETTTHRAQIAPEARLPVSSSQPPAVSPETKPSPTQPLREGGADSAEASGSRPALPAWRYVGLAHGAYALFETAAGLVLLDRRASHERIWFERLQAQFHSGQVPSQRLLLPVPVELDAVSSALLVDNLAFLNRHGFEIVEFGRNFFRIEALPGWMEPGDAETFLRDLLGLLREGRFHPRDIDLAREELARLAVSKAIRLPQVQTENEITSLLGQLFATRAPLTSPAGKPTYIELNHGELARRFQK